MTNLNGINGIGVGLNTNLPQRETQPEVKDDAVKDAPAAKPDLALMSGDDVLNVLAQQAVLNNNSISSTRNYDVSKYVTPEQAARIAGFVTSFEDIVAKNLESVTAELGNSVTDAAKMNIALAAADKQNV